MQLQFREFWLSRAPYTICPFLFTLLLLLPIFLLSPVYFSVFPDEDKRRSPKAGTRGNLRSYVINWFRLRSLRRQWYLLAVHLDLFILAVESFKASNSKTLVDGGQWAEREGGNDRLSRDRNGNSGATY